MCGLQTCLVYNRHCTPKHQRTCKHLAIINKDLFSVLNPVPLFCQFLYMTLCAEEMPNFHRGNFQQLQYLTWNSGSTRLHDVCDLRSFSLLKSCHLNVKTTLMMTMRWSFERGTSLLLFHFEYLGKVQLREVRSWR